MRGSLRGVLLFGGALLLGALAVQGQEEDDPNARLKARIDELVGQLRARNARRAVPDANRIVQHLYDVGDLVVRWRDDTLDRNNLYASRHQEAERETEPSVRLFEVDSLIELIRVLVRPESWDSVEGAAIEIRNDRIFVRNLGVVHQEISALLSRLRRGARDHVVVRIDAISVDPDLASQLAGRPRELTPAQAAALAGRALLGSARVVCRDGQQRVQRNGRSRSYVADYEVEIAEKSATSQAIRRTLFDGCAVQARACLDHGTSGVVLHLALDRTESVEPGRTVAIEHGQLDLPEMKLTRVRTSLWVPLERTVVVGGSVAGADSCLFLATATRVTPDK